MEKWASNTVRTLGLIFLAGFVMIGSLFLLLLSMCAFGGGFSGGKNLGLGVGYLVFAICVIVLGIGGMIKLARGMHSDDTWKLAPAGGPDISSQVTPPADIPSSISFSSNQTIQRLVYAISAQIIVSAIAWFTGQRNYWSASRAIGPHNWTLILFGPFILYHLPYVFLIYHLVKKLDRRTFTYAVAVPCVLILQSLFSLSLITYGYVHEPIGFLLMAVPWLIHFVIFFFAWKAVHEAGIHPEPGSLIVAALVTYVYLYVIQGATPFLYRLGMR